MHSPGLDLNAHPIDSTSVTTSTKHTSDAVRIAFAALLHVSIPLLVLSNQKTVILANYAAEKLLGLETADGQNLSQLGIQVAEDDDQTRYTWEVQNPKISEIWARVDGVIGVTGWNCR